MAERAQSHNRWFCKSGRVLYPAEILIALVFALCPLGVFAQNNMSDELADALAKALKKTSREAEAMIKSTNIDLACSGKGVSSNSPKAYESTEKMVRFFKTPIPKPANLYEAAQWTVVVDEKVYQHWLLKQAISPIIEAKHDEFDAVWITEREISVQRNHRPKLDYGEAVDIKINRLTGGMKYSAETYLGDQLIAGEFFTGTCRKVMRQF